MNTFDYLNKAYHYAIEKSGGIPLGLFNTDSKTLIDSYLESVDGILFTGGYDMNAKYFGQKPHNSSSKPIEPRDKFELALMKKALKKKVPILCICRGHQLLNVALGGDLYQDIASYKRDALRHNQKTPGIDIRHSAVIYPGTLLNKILGSRKIICNSSHHQAVNRLGKGLAVAAVAPDGVVEAVDLPGYPFLLSIQWHPERIFSSQYSRKLFKAFIDAAGNRN